jgi:hypothetical protein
VYIQPVLSIAFVEDSVVQSNRENIKCRLQLLGKYVYRAFITLFVIIMQCTTFKMMNCKEILVFFLYLGNVMITGYIHMFAVWPVVLR